MRVVSGYLMAPVGVVGVGVITVGAGDGTIDGAGDEVVVMPLLVRGTIANCGSVV